MFDETHRRDDGGDDREERRHDLRAFVEGMTEAIHISSKLNDKCTLCALHDVGVNALAMWMLAHALHEMREAKSKDIAIAHDSCARDIVALNERMIRAFAERLVDEMQENEK